MFSSLLNNINMEKLDKKTLLISIFMIVLLFSLSFTRSSNSNFNNSSPVDIKLEDRESFTINEDKILEEMSEEHRAIIDALKNSDNLTLEEYEEMLPEEYKDIIPNTF